MKKNFNYKEVIFLVVLTCLVSVLMGNSISMKKPKQEFTNQDEYLKEFENNYYNKWNNRSYSLNQMTIDSLFLTYFVFKFLIDIFWKYKLRKYLHNEFTILKISLLMLMLIKMSLITAKNTKIFK